MVKQNNVYGIFFILIHAFSIALLYTVQKQLVKTIPPSQMVLLYKFTLFVFISAWVLRRGFNNIKTPYLKLHIVRSFFSTCGSLCLAYGLKHTELVSATALGYIEQILWAIIGISFFKEQMTKLKLAAILISFSAVMLITFPELPNNFIQIINGRKIEIPLGSGFNPYYFFIFAAACFWACNTGLIKVLGKSGVKNEVQAFYVLLFALMFSAPVALINWQWNPLEGLPIYLPSIVSFISIFDIDLNATQMIQLGMLAGLYFMHVIAFFLAAKYADMSILSPFDYTRLIFTAISAYYFIGEIPTQPVKYVGYAMIIISGGMLFMTEHRKRKTKALIEQRLEEEIENA